MVFQINSYVNSENLAWGYYSPSSITLILSYWKTLSYSNTSNLLPNLWNRALVISVPKSGKDPSQISRYYHIALTITLCKPIEKMINRLIVCYLESYELYNSIQCGFREGAKQHLMAVFFDLEKVYDITCHLEILYPGGSLVLVSVADYPCLFTSATKE